MTTVGAGRPGSARVGAGWRGLARAGAGWRGLARVGAGWRGLARDGEVWRGLEPAGARSGVDSGRPEGADVVAVVDSTGTLVEGARYSAYGVPARYEFWPAPASSLYSVRHRVLHSDLGRWTRRDPLGYVDGMSLYSYVQALVLLATDAFGLGDDDHGTGIPDPNFKPRCGVDQSVASIGSGLRTYNSCAGGGNDTPGDPPKKSPPYRSPGSPPDDPPCTWPPDDPREMWRGSRCWDWIECELSKYPRVPRPCREAAIRAGHKCCLHTPGKGPAGCLEAALKAQAKCFTTLPDDYLNCINKCIDMSCGDVCRACDEAIVLFRECNLLCYDLPDPFREVCIAGCTASAGALMVAMCEACAGCNISAAIICAVSCG
jgi:RHS repeat-associated protein